MPHPDTVGQGQSEELSGRWGVAIYGAMPLPEAGFQCRRLPEPGRNERCLRAAWSDVRKAR